MSAQIVYVHIPHVDDADEDLHSFPSLQQAVNWIQNNHEEDYLICNEPHYPTNDYEFHAERN